MVLRDRPSFSHRLSANRSSVADAGSESAFMPQEPALDAELETVGLRAHESPDGAPRGDHAMAGNHDGNRIRAAGTPHGPRRRMEVVRDFSISARLPRGNPLHRFPDGEAVARPRKLERQVELELRIVEIRLELHAR